MLKPIIIIQGIEPEQIVFNFRVKMPSDSLGFNSRSLWFYWSSV